MDPRTNSSGSHSFTNLDDKCVPSRVRWFCSPRLRRMQGSNKAGRCVISRERSRALLSRSGSDDRKGMFILVRGYKSHESLAKDLDTNFADYTQRYEMFKCNFITDHL